MHSIKGKGKAEKKSGKGQAVKNKTKMKTQDKKHHQRKPVDKKGRIVIRNISFKASKDDIQKHFSQFGNMREVNLLLRPDGKPVGCGFVQFNNEDAAAKAIESCNGFNFMGRKISVDWALQRDHYIVSRPDNETEGKSSAEAVNDLTLNAANTEGTITSTDDVKSDIKDPVPVDPQERKLFLKKKRNMENKMLHKVKKGRIIVRNLPFKITEDGLRKHFSSFGELSEVSILRRPDGKMVGCGFIQFTDRKVAAKAIVECSGKPLLGRPIVLDWAVQKNLYESKVPKKEKEDVKIKVEPDEECDDIKEVDKTVSLNSDSEEEEVKSEESDSEDKSSSDDDEDIKEESDEDVDVKEEDEDFEDVKPSLKRPKVISNDVSEGKTVFIKNVPFSATNDDLKASVEKFGPVYYALICVDRLTEHSKGTAFVKFTTKESAEKCLTAGTEFTIHGQVLDPQRALHRDEISSKATKKSDSKSSKDSRNLFLVKEGVILAGTPAAEGVSVTDMAKRLQLEQWKSQMLRNLNMFVARDRLAIHNVPPSYDDAKLRELFQKHAGPNAVIKEARVMRDMRKRDLQGVGVSKETGFVKFSTHEDALRALRKINNNPTIFSTVKRPIVAFSIENRAIHKVRQQRELKSRAKNPTFMKRANQDTDNLESKPKKSFSKAESRKQKRKGLQPAPSIEADNFSGVASKPGDTKLRSKFKLRAQADQHLQAVRKVKNKAKSNKRFAEQKKIQQESIRQPKQKQGKKKNNDDSNFSKLVNNYVAKLSNNTVVKSKWYDS